MLTVLLECENSEPELAYTLSVLVSGAVDGVVSEVIVLDKGSQDGTARLADAAGCKISSELDIGGDSAFARGENGCCFRAGGRPQNGWVEEVLEHAAVDGKPARFSQSRRFRLPWFKRIMRRTAPLENGLARPQAGFARGAEIGLRYGRLCQARSAAPAPCGVDSRLGAGGAGCETIRFPAERLE